MDRSPPTPRWGAYRGGVPPSSPFVGSPCLLPAEGERWGLRGNCAAPNVWGLRGTALPRPAGWYTCARAGSSLVPRVPPGVCQAATTPLLHGGFHPLTAAVLHTRVLAVLHGSPACAVWSSTPEAGPACPGPSQPASTSLSGDSASWSEADWHWDPVSMTATALVPAHAGKAPMGGAAAAGRGTGPATGCSAAASELDSYVQGLLTSSSADEASQGGGSAAAAPPAATPASAPADAAAAAAAPKRAHGRPRKAGAGAAFTGPCICQADGCGADLSGHTYYHQRNK